MLDRLYGAGVSLQCNPSVAPFRVLAHPPVPLPPSQCAWCRVIPQRHLYGVRLRDEAEGRA